jgi:SAM-dependent methyltransferase
VGLESTEHFENPNGALVFGEDIAPANYRRVLDFGCGCGRLARQLLLQQACMPERFLGLDLHPPSIEWCQAYLGGGGFEFRHLDAYNVALNPGGRALVDFGVDEQFTLINAHSVFTHIIEPHVEFYLEQCARRLSPLGVLRSTWFLFDKAGFPMMKPFQNCLYVNPGDPTNATIYDAAFVRTLFSNQGLCITRATPPAVRGHQWVLYAERGYGAHAPFQAG